MPPGADASIATIIVVMGVAGAGKTTVGTRLADALGCRFVEGDRLHPASNVEKMTRGIPLTDADRAPWLAAIRARLEDAVTRGESLVVACSALKQAHRTAIAGGLPVRFVWLTGPPSLIQSRLEARTDHYMKAEMLPGQLDALEPPAGAIVVEVSQPPATIVQRVLTALAEQD